MLVLLLIVTLVTTLVSNGFSIAGVFWPGFIVKGGEPSHTARVMALYGVARSVPLFLLVLWAALRTDWNAIIWLGALAGIIQLVDAAIGIPAGRKSAIYGPLALGTIQLLMVLLAVWFG